MQVAMRDILRNVRQNLSPGAGEDPKILVPKRGKMGPRARAPRGEQQPTRSQASHPQDQLLLGMGVLSRHIPKKIKGREQGTGKAEAECLMCICILCVVLFMFLAAECSAPRTRWWFNPSIHNFGNIGVGGRLHAHVAKFATRSIDRLAYGGREEGLVGTRGGSVGTRVD